MRNTQFCVSGKRPMGYIESDKVNPGYMWINIWTHHTFYTMCRAVSWINGSLLSEHRLVHLRGFVYVLTYIFATKYALKILFTLKSLRCSNFSVLLDIGVCVHFKQRNRTNDLRPRTLGVSTKCLSPCTLPHRKIGIYTCASICSEAKVGAQYIFEIMRANHGLACSRVFISYALHFLYTA